MAKSLPFVIGHRGAAGLAPENTLAALHAGLKHGARYIEVDVQRTADGGLVLFHDDTLERLTDGGGSLPEKTLDELRRLDAGSRFSPQFAGERIPTLDEALQLAMAEDATLVIEAKGPSLFPGIAGQLAAAIRRHEAARNTVVISFDHAWLKDFKALAPEIPVGLIAAAPPPLPSERWAEIIDLYWVAVLLRPWLPRRWRRRGYRVWVWTVNRIWAMRLLRWLGVQGITTDRPDRWRRAFG